MERIIKKLQTANNVLIEADKIKLKPNKRLIAKLLTTKETLIGLLKIYQRTNKYVIFSDSDTELFTKHPIFEALEAIDFILIGKKHSIDTKQIIAQQIGYLQRAIGDKDLLESEYCFNEQDSATYYTLLNNLQSLYTLPYDKKDIVIIAYTMIYEVLHKTKIKYNDGTEKRTQDFLLNFLKSLKTQIDLSSPILDALSIDCAGSRFMAIPTLYFEHHGQKFNKNNRQKIKDFCNLNNIEESSLIFYQINDRSVVYTAINYASNKLHIRLPLTFCVK